MKAVSKGVFKTTVQAPKGETIEHLHKKAKKYIKAGYTIEL